jgi:hypothetical protein
MDHPPVLPTDTAENVSGMTGCLGGGKVVGQNIAIPPQYVMDIKVDPDKRPCVYKCALFHERVHARQCSTFGEKYYTLSQKEAETPAYSMQLGCYLRLQYENKLGPYKDSQ